MRLQCSKSTMFLYDIVWHSHAHTIQKQLCLCCNSLAGFVDTFPSSEPRVDDDITFIYNKNDVMYSCLNCACIL